jgi:hypothetical protein
MELVTYLKAVGDVSQEGFESMLKAFSRTKNRVDTRNTVREKAAQSIMQFPVLISDTVTKSSALMINKALEAEYANLMRLAMSNERIYHDMGDGRNINYTRSFHTNMDRRDLHRNMQGKDSMIARDVAAFSDSVEYENFLPIANLDVFSDQRLLREALDDNLSIAIDDLNESILNDLTIKNLSEADDKKDKKDRKIPGIKTELSSTDVKKANEMLPTMIDVEVDFVIYARDSTGRRTKPTVKTGNLLLGVQCVQHLIPTNEMTYFVSRSIKENNFIFKTIQWTTGEIKFFKDLILGLDRIKEENAERKNVSSHLWRRLRYMSNSNKVRLFFDKNKHIPIATVVMTMEEVELIKNTQGIDLTKSQVATSLMDVFLLLGFVILDEVDEMAWVFEYENGFFKHYSYEALKKEAKDSMSPEVKALLAMAAKNR